MGEMIAWPCASPTGLTNLLALIGRTPVFSSTPKWGRAYAISALSIGLLFMTLGLLSTWAVFAGTSGTTRLPGVVQTVQAQANSSDSVHLLVKTDDGHVVRHAASTEVASDYSPGERVAVLVKSGQEPILDDGSGRYTGSLITLAAGIVPLMVGIILRRSRDRLGRESANPQSVHPAA
ncbi:hypothetical protein GCM10009817_27600 [Terrabacter lapilli]|uniref:DUF3592 domain-containing protein n=1 Tax=Terrabacter lapilli TaxID=436231 RepID=A0ABP5DQJ1_9MICO